MREYPEDQITFVDMLLLNAFLWMFSIVLVRWVLL
jgi:hypothetical protein